MNGMRVVAVVAGVSIVVSAGGLQAKETQGQQERPPAIELKAVGEPKEIPLKREVSGCRIEVTAGTVVINTIVVRAAGQKTPITVGRRLGTGEALDLPLGPKQVVDSLRISDSGGGDYKIFICADPPPGAKPPEPPSNSKRSDSSSSRTPPEPPSGR